MGQVPPGPSPRPQQRLWGSHMVLLWFGTPHFAQAVGLTGGWEQGGGSVPAGSPPSSSPLSPHTHKDRSGPFLLWEPGLNAGVVPSVGPQSGRAGPVGVRAETIKRCFVCKPLDWGGCSLLGGGGSV